MPSLEHGDGQGTQSSSMRPLVLLAFPDAESRAKYAYALAANGFDVAVDDRTPTTFANPPASHPDIAIADVLEESEHGWDIVRTLKRDQRTTDIPIVAMAADAGASTRDRARREGCVAVCLKTCPADTLTVGLRAVLERAGRDTSRHPR